MELYVAPKVCDFKGLTQPIYKLGDSARAILKSQTVALHSSRPVSPAQN